MDASAADPTVPFGLSPPPPAAATARPNRLLPRLLDPRQVPTVRNAVLKYGSWEGFFREHDLDLACLQARVWRRVLALVGFGLGDHQAQLLRPLFEVGSWSPIACCLPAHAPAGVQGGRG